MRAALYARYSTDMQRSASIGDQLHACRRLAAQLGATIVRELSDAAISGQAMANRPGLQDLMALAEAGEIDLVIAEHTDRLTRDGGHTYDIYYDLSARDVRIHTVNQGEIGLMHVGTAGLMSSLFVEELKKKVRRGLEGVIREGRYASRPPYGYAIARLYDAGGERLRGRRVIHEAEAAVVRRIFEDAAEGLGAGEIAAALNAEAVPTRGGGRWHKAAIHGSVSRGTGILRNELYRGRAVWGRTSARKDRRTGQVRNVPSPAGVQIREAPELRIVSDDLWARAQARLEQRAVRPGGAKRGQRRGTTLLGDLVRCGCCGERMVFVGQRDLIRCGGRTHHHVDCGNGRTPRYAEVEARVLACIQANLLHPDVVETAARAWQAAHAEAQAAAGRARADLDRALADTDRRLKRLIREVEDGMPWAAAAERHAELTQRANDLRQGLATAPGAVPLLHPSAATLYRDTIVDLTGLLADAGDRATATAREKIRALVASVTVDPLERRGQYHLGVLANLAPVLDPAGATMRVAAIGALY